MRNVTAILRREITSFFVSPIAYFVITGFLILGGFFFFNYLVNFNWIVQRYQMMAQFQRHDMQPNLNQLVIEPYLHTLTIILVFLLPVLTMRLFAEERRTGTFELLMTSPVSVAEVVCGKFLGLVFIVGVMVLGAFIFPALLFYFGSPAPELAPALSGLLALFLCALGLASVGMAVSAFTESQIVAAVSSMVALLLLYVIHAPADTLDEGVVKTALQSLSPVMQMQEMVRGVISVQVVVYFLSLALFGLFVSLRALDAQRWR